VWAQFTVGVDRRDEVQQALRAESIPTAVHYPRALHRQPIYATDAFGPLPNAERAASRVISLPMSADLSEPDQDRIVQALRRAVGSA